MSEILRMGVMGGSFDPIHYGHLSLASQAAFRYGLDRVAFVPTNFSLQKKPEASPQDRCAMAFMAVSKDPRFFLSKVDIDRGGPTFAFDTLCDLHSLYAPCRLFFILGIDALLGIEKWKNWEKLFEISEFIAAARPGYPLRLPQKMEGKVEVFSPPLLGISSTMIRKKAAAGEPIDYLTDPGVCSFIRSRGLYRRENCPQS
ncbi:MAG: nicotinate-nucleotide adenylyltransferase [Aeriscardovia sp.]|nr:nicotinate-nucleotide adenylyltransferase [Aeriscardovia sp.]